MAFMRRIGGAGAMVLLWSGMALADLPVLRAAVLEQGTVGWRMFRMDNDGCAYRDAKTREGHWVVEHQQQPEVDSAALNKSATMHQLSLDPGHYFVAHWAGFFAPTEGNPEAYTGHWIHLTD